MTIYKLIFKLNNLDYSTSIYTDNNIPENLQIQETNDNRLKLNNETMHGFINRILLYSNPSLTISIKNRLEKLIKKTNIPVKNFIAGIDTSYNKNRHEILEFKE